MPKEFITHIALFGFEMFIKENRENLKKENHLMS